MGFQEIVKELQTDPKFVSFEATHPDAYLAHVFVMLDSVNEKQVQVGYYDPAKDLISTFVVHEESVDLIEDQEIAKQQGTDVLPIDIGQVKHVTWEIMDKADAVRGELYAQLPILKKFFIIQDLGGGQMYNVSYFTQDLKTINVRLDMDLQVISHDARAIGAFTRKE